MAPDMVDAEEGAFFLIGSVNSSTYRRTFSAASVSAAFSLYL